MTREEALKILRDVHDKALFSVRNALETLIPELTESEDERIRKEIIGYLNSRVATAEETELLYFKRWIAYLEKQKEQSKEELVYRLNGLMQDYIKEGKDEDEKEHRFKCYKLFWDALEDAEFFEQKEQKPILEVFGFKVGDAVRLKDGDGRKHIIKSIEEVEGIHGPNFYHVEFEDNSARDGIYLSEEYPNGYDTQMEKIEKEQKPVEGDNETEIQKVFREGKSAGRKEVFDYPEEYGLQKPAEWSEKKEKAVDNYTDEIIKWEDAHKDWDREVIRTTAYHFFNFQPKQEWSEEDELKMNALLKYLDPDAGGTKYSSYAQLTELYNWLKSIRPSWKPSEKELVALKCAGQILRDYGHGELAKMVFMIEGKLANLSVINESVWKPSEEQMNALLNAEGLVRANNYPENAKILAELYEQLKKI